MKTARVNYDQLASTYNRRYEANPMENVAHCLADLIDEMAATRVLEVGCGTGHWLDTLKEEAPQVFGLDFSMGMLRIATSQQLDRLAQGSALNLPYASGSLDLIFCVNAFHHFGDPERFVRESYRCLSPGGVLAVIGMDPHRRKENWYAYQYFDGVYEADIARFPTWGDILDWMALTDFGEVWWQAVEHINERLEGREVLTHPFLKKESTSQLALLSDEAYAAGLSRIKQAIHAAEAAREIILFRDELTIGLVAGRKPE